MTGSFILIAFIGTAFAVGTVSAEFDSHAACETAAATLIEHFSESGTANATFCLPKDQQP